MANDTVKVMVDGDDQPARDVLQRTQETVCHKLALRRSASTYERAPPRQETVCRKRIRVR